jgi:hypothetical protein
MSGVIGSPSMLGHSGLTGKHADRNISLAHYSQESASATTGSATAYDWGSVGIDMSGIYRVEVLHRILWSETTSYHRVALSLEGATTTAITQWKMIMEHVEHNSFGNLGLTFDWLIDFAQGRSYPTNIHQVVYNQAAVTFTNNNDSNGKPHMRAIRLGNSEQAASGAVTEIINR